jgi:hypothetical protein
MHCLSQRGNKTACQYVPSESLAKLLERYGGDKQVLEARRAPFRYPRATAFSTHLYDFLFVDLPSSRCMLVLGLNIKFRHLIPAFNYSD